MTSRRAFLRASDADREHVAERLRNAAAEGRLLAEELEERLSAAFSARTYGELDPLIDDLPVPVAPGRQARPARRSPAPVAALVLIAATILIASLGATLGHHHGQHAWGGASFVWLIWVALGLRLLMRRRGRWR